jgi:hypothetical protein
MTLCLGLTDNAYNIANAKLAGRPAAELKTERPESGFGFTVPQMNKVYPQLVERVYAASISHPWDYAVAFFKDCTLNAAGVPDAHSGPAVFCMQNSMITSIALHSKGAGVSRQEAYKLFAQLPTETSSKILDQVYAQPKFAPGYDYALRAYVQMVIAWDDCMTPLTGN